MSNISTTMKLLFTSAGLGVGLWCAFHPLHNKWLSLGILAGGLLFWLGIFSLLCSRRLLRWLWVLATAALVLPFLLPGRAIDPDALRESYVQRLVSYEDVPYFWGGEGRRGIDCSGLPRRAYRDALLAYGLRHANGAACRAFWEQWWFDSSARALGEGYRGFTRPLGITGTVRDLDPADLQPGDLAVTTNGLHVLIYVGEGNWIQAAPGEGRVLTLHRRRDQNSWFTQPVQLHRWGGL